MSDQNGPCEEEEAGRNLVLCFDGTGDWVGSDDTNVARIFRNLVKDERQVVFYDGGVGTLTDPQALTAFQRMALRLIDLGVATGLRDKVLHGYMFLVREYRATDRIFLFGFSRGAFTARLVAAMVENFGLLRPEHEILAPYLWQTLSSIPPGRQADEIEKPIGAFKKIAAKLKGEFSQTGVEIHFMGLFDTVSSVGVLRRFNVYPNTDHNPSVRRVCHAVSIDEARNAFPEALMRPEQTGLTEVWFPGVHRDVGGGLPEGQRRIADEALAWIEGEARLSCARFVEENRPRADEPPGPNYPDYDPYVFLGFYPMKMFVKRVSSYRFIWPNFRHTRLVPENALVHKIARTLQAQNPHYAPSNMPRNPRWFPAAAEEPRETHYLLREAGFSPPDAVGILLGVTLTFLVWNAVMGGPLGESWPAHTGAWASLAGVGFVSSMVLGQRFTDRSPLRYRLRPEGVLPALGAAVLAAFLGAGFALGWSTLGLALGAGTAVTAASQAPGFPTLTADRTMPSVLWAALGTAAFFRLFRLLPYAWPISRAGTATLLLVGLAAVLTDVLIERQNIRRVEEKDRSDRRRGEQKEPQSPNVAGSMATLGAANLIATVVLCDLARRLHAPRAMLDNLPAFVAGTVTTASTIVAGLRTAWWRQLKAPYVRRRYLRLIEVQKGLSPPNVPLIARLERDLAAFDKAIAPTS